MNTKVNEASSTHNTSEMPILMKRIRANTSARLACAKTYTKTNAHTSPVVPSKQRRENTAHTIAWLLILHHKNPHRGADSLQTAKRVECIELPFNHAVVRSINEYIIFDTTVTISAKIAALQSRKSCDCGASLHNETAT